MSGLGGFSYADTYYRKKSATFGEKIGRSKKDFLDYQNNFRRKLQDIAAKISVKTKVDREMTAVISNMVKNIDKPRQFQTYKESFSTLYQQSYQLASEAYKDLSKADQKKFDKLVKSDTPSLTAVEVKDFLSGKENIDRFLRRAEIRTKALASLSIDEFKSPNMNFRKDLSDLRNKKVSSTKKAKNRNKKIGQLVQNEFLWRQKNNLLTANEIAAFERIKKLRGKELLGKKASKIFI